MSGRPLLLAVPTLAIVLSAAPARAQVNTEAMRADLEKKTRYLSLQSSFTGHVGNVNGAVVSAGAFAGATFADRNLVFLKLQGDYAEFSGKSTVAKAFAHARYNVRFLPFLYGEVFAQVEMDRFLRLALRQVDGVGVRFGILQQTTVRLFYGTAWMLDYEALDGEFVFGGGPRWFAQRWSNYLAASWKLTEHARLTNTFYVQPRFNGFSDVRVLEDATFVMDIDKHFSAKVDLQIHHNTTPPVAVKPTDVDTVTSLVFTL